MNSWHSYPSIYALGHKALTELLLDDVLIEEKIDGSQFSFGVFDGDNPYNSRIRVRSRGAEMYVNAPEKMFQLAVNTVKELEPLLRPGWTYRTEYLCKPHHNSLSYSRTPAKYLIIFDINDGQESYLSYENKIIEGNRLGLEVVPRLYFGKINNPSSIRDMLSKTSTLGGQTIEGVVVKNYNRFGRNKKCLMGKFVSEKFKEVHSGIWKEKNPKSGDIVDRIIDEYRSPARWQKSVLHLMEAGKLENSPRDIGLLIREIPEDIKKECCDEIKEKLFLWCWDHIGRGVTRGMPEWYKEKLLERQFSDN